MMSSYNNVVVVVGERRIPVLVDVTREYGRIFMRNLRVRFRKIEREANIDALRAEHVEELNDRVRQAIPL